MTSAVEFLRKLLFCFFFIVSQNGVHGILYPFESEFREVLSLDGIWKFRLDDDPNYFKKGFKEKWFSKKLPESMSMPVPSSFNDVTTSLKIQNYVGWSWYQRNFYAPSRWGSENRRVFLRFGSVNYYAEVWLNGKNVGNHEGGFLPFQFEISDIMNFGNKNIITVAVNNTLTRQTIPQGDFVYMNNTELYPPNYYVNYQFCDYFNYAGIHRSVLLYVTPRIYIDDLIVSTDVVGNKGILAYNTSFTNPTSRNISIDTYLYDNDEKEIMFSNGQEGKLTVESVNPWWPYQSNPKSVGYLYKFKIVARSKEMIHDIYYIKVGFRNLTWNSSAISINGRKIYLFGFGKHEDAEIRGRGFDNANLIRDHQLFLWLGANSYRTSHYPYSEEELNLADESGIMVIDESPACNLDYFDSALLDTHKNVLDDMVDRDKNHPSVIMWSLANEPNTESLDSANYFSELYDYLQNMDPTRPITFVTSKYYNTDLAMKFMDVICLNRYAAWYSDSGDISLIGRQIDAELGNWYNTHNKPIIMTEYGAGAIPRFHAYPASMWTEDYQSALFKEHFSVFDKFRNKGILAGEMVWNFKDFRTPQEITRPIDCMKGVLTRNRQPKMGAYVVKERYWKLANNSMASMVSSRRNKMLKHQHPFKHKSEISSEYDEMYSDRYCENDEPFNLSYL